MVNCATVCVLVSGATEATADASDSRQQTSISFHLPAPVHALVPRMALELCTNLTLAGQMKEKTNKHKIQLTPNPL